VSARRRPIGYFVHHQGRGHAERCAAVVAALPVDRPVTVFCANPDALPTFGDGVEVVRIPSLFEPSGAEASSMDRVPQPDTVHCAPLGWPGIRNAMRCLVEWFDEQDPALIVCDVSAEIAQLARLCSVPHVAVLQHGVRDDPGHRAAYAGAAGILAPFDRALCPPDWPAELLGRTCFAGGLGVRTAMPSRESARERLGIERDADVHLVVSGGGGEGFASAALGLGARTFPDVRWHTIGTVRGVWHATEPSNLVHHGWVSNPLDHIAAADLVVSSTGNTICQQVLAAGKPWITVPEWCYFDEQRCKADALGASDVAHVEPYLPSHAAGWRTAVAQAFDNHDPGRQRALVDGAADRIAADWLDALCVSLWEERPERAAGRRGRCSAASARRSRADAVRRDAPASVLTIAAGRDAHLANLLTGLSRQSVSPAELVIGVMQERRYENLPDVDFPVRQIHVPPGEGGLPLAAARNRVARAATADRLLFLDVDCIPATDYVADYTRHLARLGPEAGLLMGEMRYLPEGATSASWSIDTLEALGVEHDSRAGAPAEESARCEDYRCFWSLNFAMTQATFAASGGFDERYRGYGGEDTDFGRTLVERDVALRWVRGARAFHQYHTHLMPPLHQVEAVVANAERFADKWGVRTMDHWLHGFALLGLIEDTPTGIRIVRKTATKEEIALCAPSDGLPYASTGRALDRLEHRVRTAGKDARGSAAPERFDRKRFLHRPTAAASGPAVGS